MNERALKGDIGGLIHEITRGASFNHEAGLYEKNALLIVFTNPDKFPVARALIDLGLDPFASYSGGSGFSKTSPFLNALRNGCWETAEFILSKIDHALPRDELTSASNAINLRRTDDHKGALRVLHKLAELGENFNALDLEFRTPMHWLGYHADGDLDFAIPALISVGANINAVSGRTGQTPLILAAKCGNLKAMKAFLHYGADPMLRDFSGRHCLYHLCVGLFESSQSAHEQRAMFETLCSRGLVLDAMDLASLRKDAAQNRTDIEQKISLFEQAQLSIQPVEIRHRPLTSRPRL